MMFVRPPRLSRVVARSAVRAGAARRGDWRSRRVASPSSRFYTLGDVNGAASAAASGFADVGGACVADLKSRLSMCRRKSPKTQLVDADPRDRRKSRCWKKIAGRLCPAMSCAARCRPVSLSNSIRLMCTGRLIPMRRQVYRVSMNVQRFESWPGSHALIDAVWSVRAVRRPAVMTCRSVVSEPVGGGYDALVDGHRRALMRVSAQVAAARCELWLLQRVLLLLRRGKASARGSVPGCPALDAGVAGRLIGFCAFVVLLVCAFGLRAFGFVLLVLAFCFLCCLSLNSLWSICVALCGAALTFFAAAKKVSKESGLTPLAYKWSPLLGVGSGAPCIRALAHSHL